MVTERVILVGVDLHTDENFEHSMEELDSLAKACAKEPVGRITQTMDVVNKPFYIGPGKVVEVRELAETLLADAIIFDNTLSPMQIRNLQEEIGRPVEDRTALILAIFEKRARSREAILQVEAAKLEYMLPRLVGLHDALSRQGGASGSLSNKGAGEKKLELDRRKLEHRLTELKKELKEVAAQRKTQRKKRSESGIPRVALVGYTNAGKSTLMNALISYGGKPEEKKVEEKDMLFATLDTTVRQIMPEGYHTMLLSDTVGFIDKLPHNLIEAFHSTLEEAVEADLLLQVVDYSDPHYKEQIETTNATLHELGAEGIPMIYVYNKADLSTEFSGTFPQVTKQGIIMSAKDTACLPALLALIEQTLTGRYRECDMLIPYQASFLPPYFKEQGSLRSMEYLPEGIRIHVVCPVSDYQKYQNYVVDKTAMCE